LNFKFFRMLYGRFFGKDNFNAPFEDPDSFFKPFTFISVFSLISTMLPLLVGNIIGLVFIEYGYQVFINCLEMTIIEVVILALSIYEYILLKKHLIK
jgi:ABC-type sugar transport system permease subunit